MKQRVIIAIALACNPQLLIADEPTTALDVTIQAQVLELMKNLKDELNTAMLLITHDLGVVAEVCDDVATMYAGEIVESGTLEDIFDNASHPYTKGYLYLSGFDSDIDSLDSIPVWFLIHPIYLQDVNFIRVALFGWMNANGKIPMPFRSLQGIL